MNQIQRLVALTPNGGRLPAIPVPTQYSFSCPLNEISGATLEYRNGAVGASAVADLCEIAAEYSVDSGLTWVEYPNGRFLRLGRSSNEVDLNGVRSYTLPGYGWLLSKMRQMKTTGLNADGKRTFNSANAGMIMKTLIDEAHSRGVCTGLGYAFTSSVDSAGAAWNKVISIAYEPGLDLLTILLNLSQQGIVDWRFQGRVLQVFNADGVMAVERPAKFQFPHDFAALPVQGSYEDFVHNVLVLGDNGKRLSMAQPAPIAEPWGKWEGFIGQGGVSDTATMTILASSALSDGDHEKLQYTAEVETRTTRYEPFVDYNQGDFITIPTESGDKSFRIRQINWTRDSSGDLGLDLIINDRFVEKEIRTARRVNGITGGASSGGNGSTPTKDPAARQPKKPDGLVVDTVAIVNSGGGVDSWATMSYPAVELDKDDVALEISGYRFQARQPVLNLIQENPSFESAYTGQTTGGAVATLSTAWASDGLQSLAVTPGGVDNASIALPMGSGSAGGAGMLKMGILPGKKYVLAVDVRLAAAQGGTLNANARKLGVGLRNAAGVNSYIYSAAAPNRAGITTLKIPFQASVGGVNAQDVFVRFFNGSSRVQDVVWFDNLRIYNDTQSPWDAWESWGSSSGLTHSYGPLNPGVEWQVQMAAISAAGVPGPWSDSVTIITASDVDPPAVPSAPILTTRLGTLTVAWDGKNSDGLGMARDFERCLVYQLGVADPIGSIYSTRTPMVLTEVVIGDEYEFWFVALDRSGNESGPGAHSSATVASIMDDPEAALDIQNGVTVASGGNNNTYSPNDPSGIGSKENDKWFKLTAGVTVGVWRWDGAAWVAETLDNQVIANLDAGKITTGTLAAARIAAGSITTDKIDAGAITGAKLSVDAIDGKTINGVVVNGGSFSTNGRTSFDDFNTGIFMRGDGVTSFRADATPAVAGGHMMLINPVGNYVRIGTPGNGNGGYLHIDGNGRIRSYLNSGSALFLDINPSAGSQNMRIGGAILADSLNLGDGMAGTVHGIFTATSAGISIQPNGTNKYVSITSTGSQHLQLNAGGTGQVRSQTIAADVLTQSDTISMALRTGTGQMGIIGSARRFKVNIQDHRFSGDILSLSPRRWNDRHDTEKYAEMLDNILGGVDPTEDDLAELPDPNLLGYGLIAEEVEAAGLGEFVQRNADGDIISLSYDRMWVALIPVMREMRDRIEQLENANG